MITGDHPDTARAVGRELGILGPPDEVLEGRELESMSDDELRGRVRDVTVYARVTAEHKLRIVRAWKANGAVVAMTGDGVNDAPALKEASIGIAMGITGTEVTKEASDLVITDDNFASIVAAVEEGRGIYDNILKTLGYLVAGNAGELSLMLVAGLLGWPLPLLPIQLLWVNLVTDGFPALALATDPIDRGVLDRPPRRPDGALLDRASLRRFVFIGAMSAAVTLFAFGSELARGSLAEARNAAFTVLVFEELFRSFSARSDTKIVWEVGLFSNLRLLAVVAGTFGLQLAMHHVPALAAIFGGVPVTLDRYVVWVGIALLPVTVIELTKLARRFAGHRRALGGAVADW
jgi:Ca2+-transporting ATPase